jgi:hypothetical protein|tara:strand:- start:1067 stop:1171 length:105 start_codon:yes stop_codon:yes gene_type:complete
VTGSRVFLGQEEKKKEKMIKELIQNEENSGRYKL